VPRLTPRARAAALAGLYAALGIANCASAARRSRAGVRATKPLLMPVLAAFALAAAGDRRKDMRLPAAGMALSGLGDVALLGPEGWLVPGMGAFAAAHACYIAALARGGAASGVRPRVAAGYAALWAVLIAALWRRLGSLRVPVAAYSLLLVSMAVLSSGRNREAAAGGALFVASDALIACGLAGVSAAPRQESAVMPSYIAAQFLLAIGYLRPQRAPARPGELPRGGAQQRRVEVPGGARLRTRLASRWPLPRSRPAARSASRPGASRPARTAPPGARRRRSASTRPGTCGARPTGGSGGTDGDLAPPAPAWPGRPAPPAPAAGSRASPVAGQNGRGTGSPKAPGAPAITSAAAGLLGVALAEAEAVRAGPGRGEGVELDRVRGRGRGFGGVVAESLAGCRPSILSPSIRAGSASPWLKALARGAHPAACTATIRGSSRIRDPAAGPAPPGQFLQRMAPPARGAPQGHAVKARAWPGSGSHPRASSPGNAGCGPPGRLFAIIFDVTAPDPARPAGCRIAARQAGCQAR
jgi:uncharacterized membrane protein YhhN